MSDGARLPLAADFDTPRRQDWERLVEGVLSRTGAHPDTLSTTTDDGMTIRPLYTADDTAPEAGPPGLAPFVRGARPQGNALDGWDVRALHADPDPASANEAILADLEGGVTSLWLRLGHGGMPVAAMPDALREVRLDLAPVVLDAGAEWQHAAETLLALFDQRGVPAAEVGGTLGADPLGLRARTGDAHAVRPAAEFAARVRGRYPGLRVLVADGLPYHEAGASDAQELGAAVATGVAYLRALTDAGLDVATAAAAVEFRLAATADQFGTIAKLRAARRVWSRVTEVSGTDGVPMCQHVVTSPVMLTRRDASVNMLRITVACFAAGAGGADAVTVLPYDAELGLPDRFSRRLARNTQAILLAETKLASVIDPAGGSHYVENRTDELAHAAWREFTTIERGGGVAAELDSGALAGRLDATWQRRRRRLATRAEAVTGISEFPLLDERLPDRAPAPPPGGSGGLPRVRRADDYEDLRDRADAHLARHGRRPRVFLATLGPLAEHTARATFAANLLRAGGIEPVDPGETGGAGHADQAAELVAAFRDSGSTVACLCGGDRAYAERAEPVAAALREAGATTVLLAGRPAEYAGVSDYVHAGCDAPAVLASLLDTLGVA